MQILPFTEAEIIAMDSQPPDYIYQGWLVLPGYYAHLEQIYQEGKWSIAKAFQPDRLIDLFETEIHNPFVFRRDDNPKGSVSSGKLCMYRSSRL